MQDTSWDQETGFAGRLLVLSSSFDSYRSKVHPDLLISRNLFQANHLLVCLKNLKKSEVFRNFNFAKSKRLNLEIESPTFPEFRSENEKILRFFPFSSEGE
ncbi:hypothetical protein [Leptospira interrogans]|uniref:hypothetical protein n=1 Tax=Leptospira interrogans TaxID=173 RepID=UPI000773829F|nr:hypothetical protein [Leptospira interrogans]